MATFLGVLNLLMPVIIWLFGLFRVSKDQQAAFINKIQSAKDDGKVSVESKDEFARQDAELAKPIEGDNESGAKQ